MELIGWKRKIQNGLVSEELSHLHCRAVLAMGSCNLAVPTSAGYPTMIVNTHCAWRGGEQTAESMSGRRGSTQTTRNKALSWPGGSAAGQDEQ